MSIRPLLVDPSGRGGIANYTAMIASSLQEAGAPPVLLVPEGTAGVAGEVLRLLPTQEWGRAGAAGPAFYLRRARQWAAWAQTVRRVVSEQTPDVVHFQAAFNRRLDGRLLRDVRRSAAVVWTAHDVLPFEGTAADADRFADIYRSADAVIVHGAEAAEQLSVLSEVHAFVVQHPVPARLTDADRAAARARLGLPPDERIAAALGFVREYKGYDLLVETWEQLGDAAPLLLLMGEPMGEPGRAVAERLAALPGVSARLEYVDASDLELAAAAADVVLLPYTEASESGLLHLARAVGTPVITSDQPLLRAAVAATSAGIALPRSVEDWARALSGPPPPPPPSPAGEGPGAGHLEVYEAAARRNAARRVRAVPRRSAERVRVVAYTDAVTLGGAEQSLATLLEGLDERFEIVVMGVSGHVVDWLARQCTSAEVALVAPVSGKRDIAGQLAHLDAVWRLRPEIFHANMRMPFACQYGIAAALAVPGVQVVVVEHSITRATSPFQRHTKRIMSSLLDAHVSVGERLARAVEEEVGLPGGSIRTIHNGVPDRRPAPEAVGLPRPLIGSVGRLSPEKGYDVLLEAMRSLGDVHLALAGAGRLRPELEALAERLGVSERVTFAGWVPDARAWVEAYDVFVLPSRSEGLPLTIIEAMLAERPVVATAVGGIPELIEDGETGLVVPSEDPAALAEAIASLARDPAARDRMGRAARVSALERFTPAAMRSGYEALYDELIAQRGSGRSMQTP